MKILFIFSVFILLIMFSQRITGQIQSQELKDILGEARAKYKLPSIAAVLVNLKQIKLAEIEGVRIYNLEDKATLEDYYHIGSCSKSILANIAGKLIVEQKINWDTKFFEVYPEILEASRSEYVNISLEDLFLCRAGIKAYTSGDELLPKFD